MLGWEYNEISVTHHPERIGDVRQLVPPGKTSMPQVPVCLTPLPLPCSALSLTRERVGSQIFFGDHHVGGGSDLAALIMANEHLALYEATAPFQTPPPPLPLSFHARISVLGGRAVNRPTEAARPR